MMAMSCKRFCNIIFFRIIRKLYFQNYIVVSQFVILFPSGVFENNNFKWIWTVNSTIMLSNVVTLSKFLTKILFQTCDSFLKNFFCITIGFSKDKSNAWYENFTFSYNEFPNSFMCKSSMATSKSVILGGYIVLKFWVVLWWSLAVNKIIQKGQTQNVNGLIWWHKHDFTFHRILQKCDNK